LRDLANFLVFLQDNDTTLAFSKHRIEKSFHGIIHHLNSINQKLQTARIDREQQVQYLQTVVRQVDTGIIAYDQDGNVELFNQAAGELLGIQSLREIGQLVSLHPGLADFLIQEPKHSSSPVQIEVGGSERLLSIKSGSLKFKNRQVFLLSFQNIKPELEAGELDAWRKLIRIQRHEITNSMTPIMTLTTAIRRRLKKEDGKISLREITGEHIEDVLSSVEVIEDRSRSLIDFMERFRDLTNVPELRMECFPLKRIFERLEVLYAKDLKLKNISLQAKVNPEDLPLVADERLLEQVIINLVKNALEAINHLQGSISISAFKDPNQYAVIRVADNGPGIDPVLMESIFIPSFTTKPNGSGIGLSIARQIIQQHKGTIGVRSVPGKETVFEIVIPGS